MKGLIVIKPGKYTIRSDVPEPTLGPYNAIVENLACGICNGTDLKIIEGHLRGYQTYPAVLGHESVGRIIKLGAKVRNYRKGDIVLRSMLYTVGPTYHSLWGGLAEYGTVYDYQAMVEDKIPNIDPFYQTQQVIPADIDPAKAVMLITLKEAAAALKRLDFHKGIKVMIVGCGPVGLSIARLAIIFGASTVIVAGHHIDRLKKAIELGAQQTINSLSEDTETVARNLFPDGIDLFIDAVGNTDVIKLGMNLVAPNGTVAIYGLLPEISLQLDLQRTPYNWSIRSVQWPVAEEEVQVHDTILCLVKNEKLDLNQFVTHVVPLDDFDQGVSLITSRQALKVAVRIK